MCTERQTFPTSCRMHRRKRPGRAPCIRSKILSPPYFFVRGSLFLPAFFSDIIIAIQLTSGNANPNSTNPNSYQTVAVK